MFIATGNFKLTTKDENGKAVHTHYKVGQKVPMHEMSKELEKAGLIKSQEKLDLENLAEVEKAIAAKKADLASLEERAKVLKSKMQSPEQKGGATPSHGNAKK
jgi:hypothetical protein